jgi:hypothetical protein
MVAQARYVPDEKSGFLTGSETGRRDVGRRRPPHRPSSPRPLPLRGDDGGGVSAMTRLLARLLAGNVGEQC